MQTYYFNLNFEEGDVIDPEGVPFPDLEAARREALDNIRELAAQHIKRAKPLTLRSIRICEESGSLLAEVAVDDALSEVMLPVITRFRRVENHR